MMEDLECSSSSLIISSISASSLEWALALPALVLLGTTDRQHRQVVVISSNHPLSQFSVNLSCNDFKLLKTSDPPFSDTRSTVTKVTSRLFFDVVVLLSEDFRLVAF